jgi:diadenosine tetraphosphate (Ap4A) HIT family hydrolase
MNLDCSLCETIQIEDYRHIMRNELAIAVIIREPLIECHSLVLPVRHMVDWVDLYPDESKALHELTNALTQRMNKQLGCAAIAAINSVEYRTQPHIHYQIFPVYAGLRTIFASHERCPERQEVGKEELERQALLLR